MVDRSPKPPKMMLTAGNLVELRLMVEIDPIPESREQILAWFWFMGNKYGSVARL